MNWYKKAQNQLLSQYQQLTNGPTSGINIIGSGIGKTVNILGQTISAKTLMDQVVLKISNELKQNGVHTIDTNPISNPNAQGLNQSNRPGIVMVDLARIMDNASKSLPPTTQTDGMYTDPDAKRNVVQKISQWILNQFANTSAHQSMHNVTDIHNYQSGVQSGTIDFSNNPQSQAQNYGNKIGNQYYKAASKKKKKVNPWAVCHSTCGPKKSKKFQDCVMDIKKKYKIAQIGQQQDFSRKIGFDDTMKLLQKHSINPNQPTGFKDRSPVQGTSFFDQIGIKDQYSLQELRDWLGY